MPNLNDHLSEVNRHTRNHLPFAQRQTASLPRYCRRRGSSGSSGILTPDCSTHERDSFADTEITITHLFNSTYFPLIPNDRVVPSGRAFPPGGQEQLVVIVRGRTKLSAGKALAMTESKLSPLGDIAAACRAPLCHPVLVPPQPGILCSLASWLLLPLPPPRVAAKLCGLW